MTSIEALADAIMQYEGWHLDSRSWRNRNPGNLRPYALPQPKDADGYRVFNSFAEGWTALLFDLEAKFNGSHGLTPQSTIFDLMSVYAPAGDSNAPKRYAGFVCTWTSHALARVINPTTTLKDYVSGA